MRDGGKAASQNARNEVQAVFGMIGFTCFMDLKKDRNPAKNASRWYSSTEKYGTAPIVINASKGIKNQNNSELKTYCYFFIFKIAFLLLRQVFMFH